MLRIPAAALPRTTPPVAFMECPFSESGKVKWCLFARGLSVTKGMQVSVIGVRGLLLCENKYWVANRRF